MKQIIVATSLLLLLGTAQAHASTLDDRQVNQKQRIWNGVTSSELTGAETRQLLQGQRELRRLERRAKADGNITPAERFRLIRKTNRESANIYRQKNNRRTRS